MHSLFWGDAQTCTIPHKDKAFVDLCQQLRQENGLTNITVNHQVHGIDGSFIGHKDICAHTLRQAQGERQSYQDKHACNQIQSTPGINYLTRDGDFLITDQPHVGIGVLTADCLPIMVHAPDQNVAAAIHAGWRGSVGGIVDVVIKALADTSSAKCDAIQVYLGPSAHACCYQVQELFLDNFDTKAKDLCFAQRDGKIYFDLPLYNTLRLLDCGIKKEHIDTTNSVCTICNNRYHSYRRMAGNDTGMRQLSMIWLNKKS